MAINWHDTEFLRLIMRSPDKGDGWRSVSTVLWPLVEKCTPDFIEVDEQNRLVRLSDKGKTIVEFAL